MAYVITQSCCSDATCVRVCPVNCIHPAPGEPDFGHTDMLYVDSEVCIDCGACADACPVDAVKPAERLTGPESIFAALNDDYYARRGGSSVWGAPEFPAASPRSSAGLRVAIVGTGPAASYAAQELLHRTDAEVTMLDRLPMPGGLVRAGVAPDHQSTKRVGEAFAALWRNPRVTLLTHVEVGRDVTRAEILEHHHAVIYASGASAPRRLGIAGEDLAGSTSATELVQWWNADSGGPAPDLSGERAVVVGTGNVALDVARLLTIDPVALEATDISDEALSVLRESRVREVVVLARRGPEHAAYTASELVALAARADLEVVVADHPATRAAIADAGSGSKAALLRDLPLVDVDLSAAPRPGRRVVLVFGATVSALLGSSRVEAASVLSASGPVRIPVGLVVAAVGYRGRAVPDLPFDEASGAVPHRAGAVIDEHGAQVPHTYVTGWVKRGPSGGIGANRACAIETVDSLLADLGDVLPRRLSGGPRTFQRLVRRRQPQALRLDDVLALDLQERERGRLVGRPRLKFGSIEESVAAILSHPASSRSLSSPTRGGAAR